ncbi:chemotaxis protein CheB [Flavobacterium selenitireducens]|uniref:chemotaxis protein CheB n=1 Tax=Flavobacterium selenitireducens TaxID=2722704 RepID=UPI00168BC5EA|nr:chemotaxis protein CheB [Flavobacterium selenitireducens]MBD3583067.1 chemotaxis protein CheB [Flavobacterium selenitireducens]
MNRRNIIVIGASAGGFDSLKLLVSRFTEAHDLSVFIVWHISPEVSDFLPEVLDGCGALQAAHAVDGERIERSRIYVAPPDHHMIIDNDIVRVTHGPKENLFRPAVDPLFRSAAYSFGNRVIGIILSGALDDGVAGLWTIKSRGGTVIVQDPAEAEVRSMPESAIREVEVDYILPVSEMVDLIAELGLEAIPEATTGEAGDIVISKEIDTAEGASAFRSGLYEMGELSPFTCPECHGVLSKITEGGRARFRCHTGHAFSAESLLSALAENIEDSLYGAIRGIEEKIMLLNQVGDHFAEMNDPTAAAAYFNGANDSLSRMDAIREVAFIKKSTRILS